MSRGWLALATAVLLPVATPARAATDPVPPVKHVWTIMLENSDLAETAGKEVLNGSAYLEQLATTGAFVPNYFGTGHSSGDNYVAMLGGQGPTNNTQGDCGDDKVVGGAYDRSAFGFDADGQALGDPARIAAGDAGCVYAADVPTLVDQLKAAGLTWRGYMEDIDASPTRLRTTCQAARWASRLNAPPGATDQPHDDYRRKHDPFEYYHSITGLAPADAAPDPDCDANVVPMSRIFDDLKSESTTPAFSYITPDQCNDGHDGTCSDGTPGDVARIDAFVPTLVDPILASPAYADGGLVVITFDEGSEAFACCGEKRSPNLPPGKDNGGSDSGLPGAVAYGRGGGQVGAILLSPYISPNTVSASCYNHYSWLRSMEDLFRLTPDRTGIAGSDGHGHIGYAGSLSDAVYPTNVNGTVVPCTSPATFGADVFTNPDATPGPDVPEVPYAALLPLAGLGVLVGVVLVRRRADDS